MARRQRSIEELKRTGSYIHSRHANRGMAVTLTPGKPRMPSWLPQEGKAMWKQLVPELLESKRLCVEDGPAMAGLCCWWAEFRQALEDLRRADDAKDAARHRQMAHLAWRECATMLKRFRLDPKARVGGLFGTARIRYQSSGGQVPGCPGMMPTAWLLVSHWAVRG